MWIFAAAWIEPAMAALLIVGLMLWTGVLEWNDITGNKAAWNTFVWFATWLLWQMVSLPPAL
jgi:L-tartrate/succinate antiporter